ncbi:DUF1653 domain-containing protein [Marinospirillum perlucidum]|uniref:DUF1653 domain-containing protein n=1 Tax=Marinospirillum perlucidum TaxID=1982602 RepID=UPI000DF3852A|nr:DUF1653 domain-containing protein [Marinospirillum perlucidum]
MSSAEVRPGIYRHFKGGDYEVLYLARHAETDEYLVIYRQLYGDHTCWARPQKSFSELVEDASGEPVTRFTRVGDRPDKPLD